MSKETPAHTERVLTLFTQVLHEIMTNRPLADLSESITPSLAQGLQFVYQHGACSVCDVAHGLSMTLPAASQLVDRLVRKDWITKSANKDDRRLSEIRLTPRGRELVEEIRAKRIEGMSDILTKMEPDHRRALVMSLESFIAAGIENSEAAVSMCAHCGMDHDPECVVNEMYQAATGAPIEET